MSEGVKTTTAGSVPVGMERWMDGGPGWLKEERGEDEAPPDASSCLFV